MLWGGMLRGGGRYVMWRYVKGRREVCYGGGGRHVMGRREVCYGGGGRHVMGRREYRENTL